MFLEVFTQRNFVADFFRQKLNFLSKTTKLRFVSPFGWLRGNVHSLSMARWKGRCRIPISANWILFASSHGWGTISGYWSKSLCSKGGWSIGAQISGRMVSPTYDFWRQKTRHPGLSRGVVCVILLLAILVLCAVRTCDRQTDRHTMTANTRASIASRG